MSGISKLIFQERDLLINISRTGSLNKYFRNGSLNQYFWNSISKLVIQERVLKINISGTGSLRAEREVSPAVYLPSLSTVT